MPYLAKSKVESYSRNQRVLKLKLENGRNVVVFGNLDNNVSEGDFEIVKELMQECKSVPILITEDNPIEFIEKKEQVPMNYQRGILEK